MGLVAYYFNCLINHCLFYILFHLFLLYSRQHTVFIFNYLIILYFYMDHESEINNYTIQYNKNRGYSGY